MMQKYQSQEHYSRFQVSDTFLWLPRKRYNVWSRLTKRRSTGQVQSIYNFLKKGQILLPSWKITFLENRFTNKRLKKCIQSILKDRSLWDIEISIFWSKKLTGEWQPHLQGGIFWFGKAFGALQFLSIQSSGKL